MERNYLTADTEMPPSMPYPRFLADMKISSTAKLLYVRLLDKTVNEKEEDDKGYLYTRFPISEQMAVLSKSDAAVKGFTGIGAGRTFRKKKAGTRQTE